MGITVLGWNLSGSSFMYENLCRYSGKSYYDDEKRNTVAKRTFQKIYNKNSSPVLCLQDIGQEISKIKNWIGENYNIITDKDKDIGVAYDKTKYELLGSKDESSLYLSYIIISIKDKTTKKVYDIASSFFSVTNKIEESSLEELCENIKKQLPIDTTKIFIVNSYPDPDQDSPVKFGYYLFTDSTENHSITKVPLDLKKSPCIIESQMYFIEF